MKLIVLNHKMNLYYEQLDKYINRMNELHIPLIIAPSSIYLIEFLKKCHHDISSQDICYIEEGNHTGKISWKQIKHLGIKYSLIGHSEKKDNIDTINAKLSVCLENGITPILCFGNGTKQENIVNILKKIKLHNIDNIIFAYEPLFNISKDDIDIKYIKEEIAKIYNFLKEKYHIEPTIIYGGGINEDNIDEIYHIDKLSGILIGSLSSDANDLEKLLLHINEK